jgi:hypothetical protein
MVTPAGDGVPLGDGGRLQDLNHNEGRPDPYAQAVAPSRFATYHAQAYA